MGKWIWEELGEGKYDLVYCIKHLNERIKVKKKKQTCVIQHHKRKSEMDCEKG